MDHPQVPSFVFQKINIIKASHILLTGGSFAWRNQKEDIEAK
jgi:hypothetical protein